MAADPDLDDVAFLSGGEDNVRQNTSTIIVCSQKRAICVAGLVCGSLLLTALIVAYGGQTSDCLCSSQQSLNTKSDTLNEPGPFKPIATNGDPFPWLEMNLPSFVTPISYTITIHPNLTTYDVKGQVAIELTVVEETHYIIIHSQNLNVTERAIMVSGNRGHAMKIVRLLEFPPRQQLYIEFKEKLKKKSNYTLNLRWFSKLNFEPDGFYLDHYENSKGIQRFLAATVFQSRGARKYFPCFNEPQFRTPFRVSIFRDRFHIGLSNSNVHKTEDVGFYMGTGLLRDDFMETPRVSSDSVSWVISDFERQSLDIDTDTVPITPIKSTKKLSEQMPIKNENNSTKSKKKIAVRSIASLTNSLNLKVLSNNNSHSLLPQVLLSGRRDPKIDSVKHLRKKVSYTFYAPEDLLTRANFIMKTAKDIMNYIETWLDTVYPLTKLDFVALPSLKKNIISSLGLISLKTSFLLDQKSTTTEENQLSAVLIAEAIVQQFFGGVTSSTSLRDNIIWRGLVKYLSILVLSSLHSQWPLKEMYTLHITSQTMDIDAMQGWASIVNATELTGQHDEFYIDKTVAIFGMLHSTIGEAKFKKCLEHFLKENYFKVDDVKNIWSSCNKSQDLKPKINVEEMMNLWMNQQGFPLVNVSRIENNITLSQTPYKINYSNPANKSSTDVTKPGTKKDKINWAFSVKYVTNKKKLPDQIWMNKAEVSFQVSDDVKWIKLNAGQNGFYRVLYNAENWQNIIEELIRDHNQFSPEDRVGLLSDGFTLCHANLISCEIIMNIIPYLPEETKWGPLTLAFGHLEKWRRILKYSECFLMLSEFLKTKLALIIERIGYLDEGDVETKMLRPGVLLASVLWEDADVIQKSKLLFNQYVNERNESIPPNLKEAIYTGAILSGEYVYWQYCWEKFLALQNTPGNFTERMQIVRSLGRTKDVWLQNRLLSHITMLPTAEIIEVLQSIAGTPVGGAIACRFLQANWFDLQSRLGEGSVSFAKVISIITQYGATNFDFDELKSIVHRFGSGPGLDLLKMTVQTVASNKEWVTRSQSSLYKWIERNLRVT